MNKRFKLDTWSFIRGAHTHTQTSAQDKKTKFNSHWRERVKEEEIHTTITINESVHSFNAHVQFTKHIISFIFCFATVPIEAFKGSAPAARHQLKKNITDNKQHDAILYDQLSSHELSILIPFLQFPFLAANK